MSGGILDGVGTEAGRLRYERVCREQEREEAKLAALECQRAGVREVLNVLFRPDIDAEYQADHSPAAVRSCRAEMEKFSRFAREQGLPAELPLAAADVASYLVVRAERGLAAASRALKLLDREHRRKGYPSPAQEIEVRAAMRGVRRWLKKKSQTVH